MTTIKISSLFNFTDWNSSVIFKLFNILSKKKIEYVAPDQADILVIDDSSPDKTCNLLKLLKNKNKNKNLNLIIRKKKEGLNTAHKIIYNFALKKKYNFLITMDADFSHNPKDVKKILSYLKFYDFVIGSRYILGGKCNMKFMRFLISKYGNLVIKYILKTNVSENTTSFRGFNFF